jgi:hypothetical protein
MAREISANICEIFECQTWTRRQFSWVLIIRQTSVATKNDKDKDRYVKQICVQMIKTTKMYLCQALNHCTEEETLELQATLTEKHFEPSRESRVRLHAGAEAPVGKV